ncbi:MAG: 7-cyano-7-deazaguanine synthase QueC [Candidatus Omnitrophica bacterium]|nr:7-cyano-7-deazaguanine synthase QueC [Candidatus Omnitrophota bacterium]
MKPLIRNKKQKAIVLLSGGLDSATTLFLAKSKGYRISALIFDYGQRHKKEINCAKTLAKVAGCDYHIIKLSLPSLGSSLLNRNINIPKARKERSGIPSTYVPARNLIFLSIAASYAESMRADTIFIGANAVDFSGYPDCRPRFYSQLRKVIKIGTKAGVEGKALRILTPLINKTKKEIIKLGAKLGVPYALTWSCYEGGKVPCASCESCLLRKKGFQEAKLNDPSSKS